MPLSPALFCGDSESPKPTQRGRRDYAAKIGNLSMAFPRRRLGWGPRPAFGWSTLRPGAGSALKTHICLPS